MAVFNLQRYVYKRLPTPDDLTDQELQDALTAEVEKLIQEIPPLVRLKSNCYPLSVQTR